MSTGSKKVTVGYRYLMSLHMGLSRGPVNVLKAIRVAEIPAWTGSVTDNATIEINQPNLFGGDEKEGGIRGTFSLWMGSAAQTFSSTFKSLMGGLVPDFRGVCTATFDGMITANNPYPKPWDFLVARWDAGWDRDTVWYPEKARILVDGDIDAMNPAHIIYECLTNRDWGRGIDPSQIDDTYFVAAANKLCAELFGLCMIWTRQQDINEFIDSVLSHIGGVRFTNNENGKIAIRLIRGDYDASTLPVFTYNSGLLSIEEDETGGGDSAFSEVIVNYVDARTGKDSTERAHSLAIMQALGDIASTTAAYPGIPSAGLAARVARRDLEQQGAFLKRFNVVLDRRAWRLNPGALFKVTAPDRGMNEVILRVGTVRDSEFKDGRINVIVTEDVFGLPSSGYTTPELGGWTPPDTSAVAIASQRIEEATYRDLARTVPPAELAAFTDTAGFIATLAQQPTPLSVSYEVATAATGETIAVRGSGDWAKALATTTALTRLASTITFDLAVDLSDVEVGTAALIDDEIVRIETVNNTTKTITVARGCVDTLPATHTLGALVWFYEDETGSDQRQYESSEVVDVALLTVTNTARLDVGDVTPTAITIGGRQARPYPPGNVLVDGSTYINHAEGTAAASGADVVFAWTHRDRELQADQLVEHGAASVGPEAGTTYTLDIYDGLTLLRSTTGISGTGFTYTAAMISADGEPTAEFWTVKLKSVRGGLDSWQEYEFPVYRRRSVAATPGFDTLVFTGRVPTVTP
jgi:hypothetical protein